MAGAILQIGVQAPSGVFQSAAMTGKDTTGRSYTLAVPLKAGASLFVSGGAFQLNDDSGSPVATSGKLTPVAAPDANKSGAAGQTPMTFTITGLTRP